LTHNWLVPAKVAGLKLNQTGSAMKYPLSVSLTFLSLCVANQTGLAQSTRMTTSNLRLDTTFVSARAPAAPLEEADLIGADMQREADALAAVGSNYKDESRAELYVGPGTLDHTRLLRGKHSTHALLVVRDLQPGVYVMHWLVRTSKEIGSEALAWATGSVVHRDGVGVFHAQQTIDLLDAVLELHVTRCGETSDDIEVLSRQLLGVECSNENLVYQRDLMPLAH
jgi:hypothetical protein